jgi:hypothetical protein
MSRSLGRLLALAAFLPLVLFGVGATVGATCLAVVLFGLPWLAAARARWSGDEAHLIDEVAWFTALFGALVTPLWPCMVRVDGFDAPVFVALGALAFLGWRGRLSALTAAPRWGRIARLGFAVWAAWSLGSALRGVWSTGSPWMVEEFWMAITGQFGQVSMVSAMAPLSALSLRLVMIGVAWAGFELALGALGRGEGARFESRMVRVLAWGIAVGFVVGALEFVIEGMWRGETSPRARLSQGLARNPRPLLDHNALGSALTLVLPLVAVGAWRARHRRWVLALAAGVGGFLLVSSRSKSALAGLMVGVGFCALLLAWSRGGLMRRWAAGLVAAGALVLVLFNVAPASVIERVSANRYGHDLVRVVRLDAARDYLRENRAAVWSQTRTVGDQQPAVGVGLGRLPLMMGAAHEPDAPGWFKPLHENAHSQYLQWRAEEGWLGLLFALLVLAGAVLGGLRRRSVRSLAASAGFVGLCVNLAVGHALLVSSVALLFAAFVGWLVAGGSMTRVADEAAEAAGQHRLAAPLLSAGALLLALSPLVFGRSTAATQTDARSLQTLGGYPWEYQAGQTPERGRAMGPDARWFEQWGDGDVLKIPVSDFRDARFKEPTRLDVWINGKPVVLEKLLPHRQTAADVNRVTYLRITRPADVQAGDWVELRVLASNYFVGTRAFSHDFRRVAFKTWPGFYSDSDESR